MLILPSSDISSDLTKSNGALAFWEHVDDDPLSPDSNNLTATGTGTNTAYNLILGLDFEGLIWDAELLIIASVTGTFPLYSIQLSDDDDPDLLPYFLRVESDVMNNTAQTLELTKGYPDHYFTSPRVQLNFIGSSGGNTLTLKAFRFNVNIRGSGGQSARNTSVLVPTRGAF